MAGKLPRSGILTNAVLDFINGDRMANAEAMRQSRATELGMLQHLVQTALQNSTPVAGEDLDTTRQAFQKYDMPFDPYNIQARQGMLKSLIPEITEYGMVDPSAAQSLAGAQTQGDIAQLKAGLGGATQKLALAKLALAMLGQGPSYSALSTQPNADELMANLYSDPSGLLGGIIRGTGAYDQQAFNRDLALRQASARGGGSGGSSVPGIFDQINGMFSGVVDNLTKVYGEGVVPPEQRTSALMAMAGEGVSLFASNAMKLGGLSEEEATEKGIQAVSKILSSWGLDANVVRKNLDLAFNPNPKDKNPPKTSEGGGQKISPDNLPKDLVDKIRKEAERMADKDIANMSSLVKEHMTPNVRNDKIAVYYAHLLRVAHMQVQQGTDPKDVRVNLDPRQAPLKLKSPENPGYYR